MFPSGCSSLQVPISVINDSSPESDETVQLQLQADGYGGQYYSLSQCNPVSKSITLHDNDAALPTVTIAVNDANASETGPDTAQFTVTRTGSTSAALTVYFTTSGTATSGSDYNSLGTSVTIPVGSASQTITLTPIDDSTAEVSETAQVNLSSNGAYTLGAVTSAQAAIADNDAATITLERTTDAAESGTVGRYTFRRDKTSGSLTVRYQLDSSSTATWGSSNDFTLSDSGFYGSTGSVTFASGQDTVTLDVTPRNDTTAEEDEEVQLRILDYDGYGGTVYQRGTTGNVALKILDDDAPRVSIAATQNAWEPSQSGYFTVHRDKTSGSLTVSFAVDAASTATYGSDYSAPGATGTVSFAAGVADAYLYVTPLDDTTLEATETVVVRLVDGTGYNLATTATASLDLLDNDADVAGPRVTQSTPSGNLYGPVDRVTLTFSEAIQEGSFTLADVVSLSGPSGAITPTAVNRLSSTQYEVVFSSQSTLGSYTLVIGPSINDVVGNPMNQDQDGTNGETTQDRYTANFTLQNAVPALDLDADDSSAVSGSGYAAAFYEDDPPVRIADADATLSDADSANLVSLVATLSGRLDGANEILSADTTGTSIAASYANGVLTLSGSDSVAHYQQVLRSLRYQNTLALPTAGTRTIGIVAHDGTAAGNTASVTLSVQRSNDIPVATAQNVTTAEDTAVAIQLAGVDGDAEVAQVLSYAIESYPLHGVLSNFNPATGTASYTPLANFTGSDTFYFSVIDDNQAGWPGPRRSVAAAVTIAVTAVNDTPLASAQAACTNRNTAVSLTLHGESGDPGVTQVLTYAIVSGPSHGTLSGFNSATGAVTYTPTAGYQGPDSFTFRVTDDGQAGNPAGLQSTPAAVSLTVLGDNHAPVAVADSYTTPEDGLLIVEAASGVRANDSDSDLDTLAVSLVSGPTHGTLSLRGDGRFLYIPESDYAGSDAFSYRIEDGRGGFATATATIAVTAVNDAPVSVTDGYRTSRDTALVVTAADGVLANDLEVDGNALSAILVSGVSHGTLSLAAGGGFTYTPAAGYVGSDSFRYKANDATVDSDAITVTLWVDGPNAAPVGVSDSYTVAEDHELSVFASRGVLANDTDAEQDVLSAVLVSSPLHGTLVLDPGGSFRYVPQANYAGSDSFTYKANDGRSDSAATTVGLTVSSVNDPPLAVDDTAATDEDSSVLIAVKANDSDVEGSALAITVLSAAHGTAVVEGSGIRFTPTPNYNGPAEVSYKLNDGTNDSNVAKATITVAAVYDAPAATNDTANTSEDTPVDVAVLANDVNADGNPLTLVIVSATHGTAVVYDNGTPTVSGDDKIRFTPEANYSGTATITYKLGDGTGYSNNATLNVTIAAVNDAPVAADDAASTRNTSLVSVNVLANDSDAESSPLWISIVSVSSGTAVVNQHGTPSDPSDDTIDYTPTAGYHGFATVLYRVNDGSANSANARLVVTVHPSTGAPVAVDDAVTTDEDTAVTIPVLTNDRDMEGNALSITIVSTSSGTATVNGNSIQFTPAANYAGTVSVTYKVHDGTSYSNVATASIVVTEVNDAPVATADAAAGDQYRDLYLTPLSNDTDVDDTARTIASLDTTGTLGRVTLAGNYVRYEPNGQFNALSVGQSTTDVFHYTVSDGRGGTAVGTVTVTITAGAPEITVCDGATIINDGTGSVGFGTTWIGGAVQKTFEIRNVGGGLLVPNPTSLALPSGYSLVGTFPASVLPGATAAFTVQLNATAAGTYSGQLSFTNSDADESPYNFTLSGTVASGDGPIRVLDCHLASDTGESATDFITWDSTFTGTVRGEFSGGYVIVEYDRATSGAPDGMPDGSVRVNTSGSTFSFDPRPSSTYTGPLAVRWRTKHYNSSDQLLAQGEWHDVGLSIVANPGTGAIAIEGFGLKKDTGSSATDRVTSNPIVVGSVRGDFAGGYVRVEFDHDADHAATVGSVRVDHPGDAFAYDPRTADATFAATTGAKTIYYRTKHYNAQDQLVATGNWASLSLTLEAVPAPTISIAQVTLQNDTGLYSNDNLTSDPTLVVTLSAATGAIVEFDTDADHAAIDGSTAGLGDTFTYLPQSVPYGTSVNVWVRVKQYHADSEAYSVGSWSQRLTFTRRDDPPPVIEELVLVSDDATTVSGVTTTPDATLAGRLNTAQGSVGQVKVLFYLGATSQTVIGSTYADADGHFAFLPTGLTPGSITIRARTVLTDSAQTDVYSEFKSFTFTYQPPAIAAVSQLKLGNDTGTSASDNTTNDATLVGRLAAPGEIAYRTVELECYSGTTIAPANLLRSGRAQSDGEGAFQFLPVGLGTGTRTVRARVSQWDANQGAFVGGTWSTSFTFTLEAAPQTLATVSGLALTHDTGTSASDGVTSDPSLYGQVENDGSVAYLVVQFDHDGNGSVDGSVVAEADGSFGYTPSGLAAGSRTLRARVREWDYTSGAYVFGPWASLGFTLEAAADLAPTVSQLRLHSDTGASSSDSITANPTVIGPATMARSRACGSRSTRTTTAPPTPRPPATATGSSSTARRTSPMARSP
jgi:VCBS repeat-containing protein